MLILSFKQTESTSRARMKSFLFTIMSRTFFGISEMFNEYFWEINFEILSEQVTILLCYRLKFYV